MPPLVAPVEALQAAAREIRLLATAELPMPKLQLPSLCSWVALGLIGLAAFDTLATKETDIVCGRFWMQGAGE